MAREIAASFNKILNKINFKNFTDLNSNTININIKSENCKRYSASIIKKCNN